MKIKTKKPNLPRGAKLSNVLINGLNQPINDLVSTGFTKDNIQNTKASFYVNYTFDGFSKKIFGLDEAQKAIATDDKIYFPIPLIPTQDYFQNNAGNFDINVPIPLLDSISISMDLRGEGAAMQYVQDDNNTSFQYLQSKNWKINYEEAVYQDIEFAVIEKDLYAANKSTNGNFQSTLFTTTIPATVAFSGLKNINNPYFISNINKQFKPFKMYYLSFNFPKQLENSFYVSNLVVSLKFITLLDTGINNGLSVLNQPKITGQDRLDKINDITTDPPVGSSINAYSTGGIQQNLEAIDGMALEKITAGVDKFGNRMSYYDYNNVYYTTQEVLTPAVYDVIVVPLWNAAGGQSGANTTWFSSSTQASSDIQWGNVPPDYYSSPPQYFDYGGVIQDIRTIPLMYPFTLHHVLLFENFQFKKPFVSSSNPAWNDFYINYSNIYDSDITASSKIGVGLGSGLQSDKYTYQQLAYGSYADINKSSTGIIDFISIPNNANYFSPSTSDFSQYSVLRQVPLHYDYSGSVDTNGRGFIEQSAPIYCGGGTKLLQDRNAMAHTSGSEQFIEVRHQYDGSIWSTQYPLISQQSIWDFTVAVGAKPCLKFVLQNDTTTISGTFDANNYISPVAWKNAIDIYLTTYGCPSSSVSLSGSLYTYEFRSAYGVSTGVDYNFSGILNVSSSIGVLTKPQNASGPYSGLEPKGNTDVKPAIVSGYGGHFLYLIGKKELTTNRNVLK